MFNKLKVTAFRAMNKDIVSVDAFYHFGQPVLGCCDLLNF